MATAHHHFVHTFASDAMLVYKIAYEEETPPKQLLTLPLSKLFSPANDHFK